MPVSGAGTNDLIAATTAGDLARVEALIAGKAPLDAADDEGRTALLIAVNKNHIDIAKALIAAGASINAQAKNLDTPWLLAGASGRTEIIRAMIPKDPDFSIHNRHGGNALIPACERAHVETIELQLTTPIDVNHVNNLGWTCLLEIVILGDGGPRHQGGRRNSSSPPAPTPTSPTMMVSRPWPTPAPTARRRSRR